MGARRKKRHLSQEDWSEFCAEVMEKLQQLEAYVQELTAENEQLQEEVAQCKGEMLILQRRLEALSTWRLAGRQVLPRLSAIRADEMPVVVLRWDSGEGDEQS